MFRERSPEARIDLIRYNIEVFLPKFFQRCENILKERGGKYFAGDKVHFVQRAVEKFLARQKKCIARRVLAMLVLVVSEVVCVAAVGTSLLGVLVTIRLGCQRRL